MDGFVWLSPHLFFFLRLSLAAVGIPKTSEKKKKKKKVVSFVIVNTHPFVPYYCNTSQWNVYDVEKIKKKGGERIKKKKMGGSSISATKDINEKEIINVYSSGPFLFFYFVLFLFLFFFVSIVRDEISGENGRVISFELYNKWETRFDEEKKWIPPTKKNKKLRKSQHSFSYFLSCYYCFVMMEERPMVDKQGARHRSARHSGPYSAKSKNRI